jgi:hypothetical protein
MKDAIHCDKRGSGVCSHYESVISEWDNPPRVMSRTNKGSTLVYDYPLK